MSFIHARVSGLAAMQFGAPAQTATSREGGWR
ncbi:Mycobacterium terramassiliense ORFan [Mycobacterium terramassiliense]|uniref:Mycobacterium terramassiliense ORFan n=1 Tax=Mycobacterium terramassiliense TaxID=1841859 RepID=A0A2U3N5Z3_9MYCO|nr:Mycobacterium terramassiliense ORFan [Mycobacterium terramassiliense]